MTSPSTSQPTTQAGCSQSPAARTFPVHHHLTSPTPDPQLRLETLLVRSDTGIDPATGAITASIHLPTTYSHPGLGESTGYDCTCAANPTRDVLQDILARSKDGTAALVLSPGMVVLELVTRTLAPHGSRIVVLQDLYGGSFRFPEVLTEEGAADVDFILGLEGLRGTLADPADLVIIETPTDPMMEEISIPEAVELAHAVGAKLAVDNTFYILVVQQSLGLRADVVAHLGAKYLDGCNDVMAGIAVVADDALAEQLNYRLNATGATLGPFDCFLLLYGLKTIALRMERHEVSATAIAQLLRSSPYVTWVFYPGHSGMMSSDLAKPMDVARFLASVRVFTFVEPLDGMESLMACPSVQMHVDVPVEVHTSYGLTGRPMRLSVGIEHVDDFIADLVQTFEAAHTWARAELEY